MGSSLMFFAIAINHSTNHRATAIRNHFDLFHILQAKNMVKPACMERMQLALSHTSKEARWRQTSVLLSPDVPPCQLMCTSI
jgi:hypothetical protein